MELRDYEDMKKRAEEAFRRAREEYEQDLAAIERVWAKYRTNGTPVAPIDTLSLPAKPMESMPNRRPTVKKGWVIQDVRSAIEDLSGTFTFWNVLEKLGREKPHLAVKRGTLNAILKRLSEIGELELVTQGIGRKPSEYRRKSSEKKTEGRHCHPSSDR
jgi:hypothetical protein